MPGNPCLAIGQTIGCYQVVRQLGEGGMGEVYEVFDNTLERRAALKVVPPELARNPEVVSRFQREAKAISQLRHPGIVHIYMYGVLTSLRSTPYFIMEYLEGETLRARIQRAARQPEGRLGLAYLPVLQQIARALAAIHQRGLVHRDLKPSNIILVPDPDAPNGEHAKLLDFGIVKILEEAGSARADDFESETHRGMILGTPLYMAPEQWRNHGRIDGKADVYALAVMMFLVLAGRMPFRAPDTPGLCFLHCHKAPPSLDSIDPSLPAALVDLVARMLAKSPAHRPTMEQVGAAIGEILTQPAAPRREPMLPEPSDLELIVESSGEDSEDALPRQPLAPGEHLPLVEKSEAEPAAPQPAPLEWSAGTVQPVTAAEAPAWDDDRATTADVAAVAKAQSGEAAALGRVMELSDQSLLVGSQYDLRPVLSYRAWISTAALVTVVVLVFAANVFHISPLRLGAARDRAAVSTPVEAPRSASAVASQPAPAPTPATVEALAKPKLAKNCQHMMPTASCVRSQGLTAPQQTALLAAFLHNEASLCAGDRLVLSGLPAAPRLSVAPKTMSHKARAGLLHELRELPELNAGPGPDSRPLPEELEILCPEPQ